eukprot:s1364_g13.t1
MGATLVLQLPCYIGLLMWLRPLKAQTPPLFVSACWSNSIAIAVAWANARAIKRRRHGTTNADSALSTRSELFVSVLHARVQGCSSLVRWQTVGKRSKRVEERTSLSRGWSPSTLTVPVKEGPRRLAAKALAAEQASKAHHREAKGGVDSELCSARKPESMCHDFDVASRRSEWMLRSRTRTLEATVTPASRAGSAVLTEGVYGTTAATGHSVGRQAQTKPAGAAKRVQGELVAVSNPRSKRPRLGLKQGMGGRVKRCKEAAGDAIVDSTGGGPLPFSSGVDRLVRACRDNGRSAGAGRRRQEAVAAQRALAHSLLELPLAGGDECDGAEPLLGDLLADARDAEAVPVSRLPAA